MSDESVCSVCSRLTGFGDEERFEPPVNLALARLRSAWLDPEVMLTDLKTRFRVQTKDYPTLRAMFGERPDTNLCGRQRVWKEKRA